MSELDTILDPATIRARTQPIYEAARRGETHFALHEDKLEACADFVVQVTRASYPSLSIPVHGRYEHLRAGGVDRVARVASKLSHDTREQARGLIDLVVVSVLLDAGAGDAWRFSEGGVEYRRSEGLAVASVALFEAGAFSHDGSPKVTAEGLVGLTVDRLAQGFQVRADNPLLGLEGRAALLKNLGAALEREAARFPGGRPGGLLDTALANKEPLPAATLLRHLLLGFSSMWPARVVCEGVPFGDVWPYKGQGFEHWVPFHKLSQWLAYSLLEPLAHGGALVTQLDALTGLPEYRNGGLFLDSGVLSLRDPALARTPLAPSHEAIIEWRALTIQLLDRLADVVRRALGQPAEALPLAKVLQGGTWAAGRRLAGEKRPGGGPPLALQLDGTVF